MKKSILILALIGVSFAAMAQNKAVKPFEKPKYNYIGVMPIQDVQQMFTAYTEWKRLCIYDPNMKAEEKVALQQNIDRYLKELPARIKQDSIKIEGKK